MAQTRNYTRRAAGLLAVVLLALAALPGCGSQDRAETAVEPVEIARADEPAVESTPRDEWRKGAMPYLYQIDPQWSEEDYAGGSFAKTGCGPTCLSMIYIYLTGNTDLDPVQMGQFSTENGYATEGEGTSWSLMGDGAAQLGITGQMVTATVEGLKSALEAGQPLICVMNPGTFTEIGHFIVVERLNSDGKALVHDPNSVGRSMRSWDLETIVEETAGVWGFSVA